MTQIRYSKQGVCISEEIYVMKFSMHTHMHNLTSTLTGRLQTSGADSERLRGSDFRGVQSNPALTQNVNSWEILNIFEKYVYSVRFESLV